MNKHLQYVTIRAFMRELMQKCAESINQGLYANLDVIQNTTDRVDYLSNGFKIRDANTGSNADGATYLYYAFAEQPLVTPFGSSSNAR